MFSDPGEGPSAGDRYWSAAQNPRDPVDRGQSPATANNELERVWKEAVVVRVEIDVPARNLC
jgi:hypothetical protein